MLAERLDRPSPFMLLFGVLGLVIGLAFVAGGLAHWARGGPAEIGGAFAFLGATGAIPGLAIALRQLAERRRVARLARAGLAIEAEVLGNYPRGSRYREGVPWRVRYRYAAPDGSTHEAESFDGPGDEARRWQRGERVAIRVDPEDYASSLWIGRMEG